MQYNLIKINYTNKDEWFRVIPLGDIHLGNSGCDIYRLKEMINWIAEKENTFWIGMGDYIDAINYTDERFDPKTVDKKYLMIGDLDKIIQMEIEDLADLLYPIRDKCLGLHRGNHEEKIRKEYHYDIIYELWKLLEIEKERLLYDAAITRLNFIRDKHRRNIDIFSTHGNVGGRKGGNKINRLEDMISFFDADIYLMAHSHIKLSEIKTQLFFDSRGNLKQRKKILAVTGSFLRGYEKNKTSYIEKWSFPPSDLGVVKIMIRPEDCDLHISL